MCIYYFIFVYQIKLDLYSKKAVRQHTEEELKSLKEDMTTKDGELDRGEVSITGISYKNIAKDT